MRLGQPAGERRNRVAELDPELVRAPEHRRAVPSARSIGQRVGRLARRQQLAVLAHLGGAGTPPARPPPRGAAPPGRGRDARRGCPPPAPPRPRRRASASRAASMSPALLPGDGDEAEIADRGAVGLRVAVDHHHALAQPRGGQRMGETADAGPDHGEIERAGDGCAHRIRQARGRARDRPDPTACRCLRWRPR